MTLIKRLYWLKQWIFLNPGQKFHATFLLSVNWLGGRIDLEQAQLDWFTLQSGRTWYHTDALDSGSVHLTKHAWLTIFIDYYVNHCLPVAVGFSCLLLERVQCHVQVRRTRPGNLGWPVGASFGRCRSGCDDDEDRQLSNVHDMSLYLC